uniref:Uncharacterized protein n=1 Tax=Anguilla anguilla TaxID=7936 RepID=A0A0E9XW64_ANGAN
MLPHPSTFLVICICPNTVAYSSA